MMGRRVEILIDVYDDDDVRVWRDRHVESWTWENFMEFNLFEKVKTAKQAAGKKMFGGGDD